MCLVWGGEKIPVTKDNLELYLSLYAAHHLKSNDDALARLKKGCLGIKINGCGSKFNIWGKPQVLVFGYIFQGASMYPLLSH